MIVVTDKLGNTYQRLVRPRPGTNLYHAEQTVKAMLEAAPKELYAVAPIIEPDSEKR